MSIRSYVTCDEPGCTARTSNRRTADLDGWRITPAGNYHYCPDHAVPPSLRHLDPVLQRRWLARQP